MKSKVLATFHTFVRFLISMDFLMSSKLCMHSKRFPTGSAFIGFLTIMNSLKCSDFFNSPKSPSILLTFIAVLIDQVGDHFLQGAIGDGLVHSIARLPWRESSCRVWAGVWGRGSPRPHLEQRFPFLRTWQTRWVGQNLPLKKLKILG